MNSFNPFAPSRLCVEDSSSPFAPLRLCVEDFSLCVEDAVPPNAMWQARARGVAARGEALLWSETGSRARAYLHERGLQEEVLRAFHVGYQPQDCSEERADWGLPPDPQREERAQHVWIPRGITLPWEAEGVMWRLNVRRPLSAAQVRAGQAKYLGPAGFGNGLYNADALRPRRPAVLVEGEFDALTVVQACGDEVAAVATGSTGGARRQPWIDRLGAASVVLVAYDDDDNGAGDQAADWWLQVLPNAVRWRPPLHDVNGRPDAAAVALWVERGLALRRGCRSTKPGATTGATTALPLAPDLVPVACAQCEMDGGDRRNDR